jgi:MYXO-CTERM domain-containing protein
VRRLLLLGAMIGSSACASEILTNSPAWDGSTSVFGWGAGGTPTYGETVTVPTDGNNVLSSFTFDIFGTGGAAIRFGAYVQDWNGTNTIGVPRFGDAAQSVAGSAGAAAYTFYPNITLPAGVTEILYFSVLAFPDPINATSWGATSTVTNADGGFFFSNVGAGSSSTTSGFALESPGAWSAGSSLGAPRPNLAFSATFVPEPSPTGLALTGIGMLAAMRRRRTLIARA